MNTTNSIINNVGPKLHFCSGINNKSLGSPAPDRTGVFLSTEPPTDNRQPQTMIIGSVSK
jgi:hypothetical protein